MWLFVRWNDISSVLRSCDGISPLASLLRGTGSLNECRLDGSKLLPWNQAWIGCRRSPTRSIERGTCSCEERKWASAYHTMSKLARLFLLDIGWDAHKSNCLVSNLSNDCFTVVWELSSYSSCEILRSDEVRDEELTELRSQHFTLSIKDVCEIVVILLACHTDIHHLLASMFRRVKQLRVQVNASHSLERQRVRIF